MSCISHIPGKFKVWESSSRDTNAKLIRGGWHGLCPSQPWTHQMHPKPLQSPGQPGHGCAVSTRTQELLLPHHHQNFRRTMETPLLFSNKFFSAANGAAPSTHSQMQQQGLNPAPGMESAPDFCSLCLPGWRR